MSKQLKHSQGQPIPTRKSARHHPHPRLRKRRNARRAALSPSRAPPPLRPPPPVAAAPRLDRRPGSPSGAQARAHGWKTPPRSTPRAGATAARCVRQFQTTLKFFCNGVTPVLQAPPPPGPGLEEATRRDLVFSSPFVPTQRTLYKNAALRPHQDRRDAAERQRD